MTNNALALNPVVGTLAEKVQAYDQMATAIANAQVVPGYDKVAKVKAACWIADALGVHPTIFMSGVHAIDFNGRVALQPKWEFEHALLTARLPGYWHREIKLTEQVCTIEFGADHSKEPITITYTMDDAVRQGHVAKNPNYKSSPKEMLWKQAFHRGAKRIGAHVLMGLPPAIGMDADVEHEPSMAAVVDDPAGELDRVVEAGGDQPKPADGVRPPEIVNHRARLAKKVREVWTLRSNDQAGMLEKINVVKTQMDGQDSAFTKLDEIGDVDAQTMRAWLDAKYPATGNGAKAGESAAPEVGAAEDEPPPAEETDSALIDNPDLDGSWEGFMRTVAKARKKIGATAGIVKDASGCRWLVASDVFKPLGYEASVKLQRIESGELFITPAECVRFAQQMYEVYGLGPDAAQETLPRHANRRREAVAS